MTVAYPAGIPPGAVSLLLCMVQSFGLYRTVHRLRHRRGNEETATR